MRSLHHMSPRVRFGVWLILIFFAVRWVENYSRRPVWTRELSGARETELAGWVNDNQFVLVSGEWDRKQSSSVWKRLAIYDQSTGQPVAEYDLPNWPAYGQFRVRGERVVLYRQEYSSHPSFDLVTRRIGQEPSDALYDEVTSSGRWRVRRVGYRCQVRDGSGPWRVWPTEELLTTWGMTRSGYEAPQDRLIVHFRELKISPDENLIATVCEQRKSENSYGDWVGRIHAWPSGEILHEWTLGKNHGNNQFTILPLAWEGDTFFVEEEMDTIGDGNQDDRINRWFRCQVRPTSVEMSVLDWTDWDGRDVRSRWLQVAEGHCFETYYHSKRSLPFPSWGWRYRLTRRIYDTFNPAFDDYTPLLRETATGQVLWQGPKEGRGRWSISRDRQFALHLPVRSPQPNDQQTMSLYPLVPRTRWPWYAALGLVAIWSWRRFDRKIDSQGQPVPGGSGTSCPSFF